MNLLTIIVGLAILGLVSSSKVKHSKLGGFQDIPVNDPDVLSLAYDGVHKFDDIVQNPRYLTLKKILKAQYAIAAGRNFVIDVVIAETYCKGKPKPNHHCYIDNSGRHDKVQIKAMVHLDGRIETTFKLLPYLNE